MKGEPVDYPIPSSTATTARMKGNRSQDTLPEMRLRRELHSRGLRYRTHVRILPGSRRRADIVFTRVQLAVFVDGCFWHGCPAHWTVARSNREYWQAKVDKNRQRDLDTDQQLIGAGWLSLRIWEHEPTGLAADLVQMAYEDRLYGPAGLSERPGDEPWTAADNALQTGRLGGA
jgi:DNA mismatch endonuclease, patch repair protein